MKGCLGQGRPAGTPRFFPAEEIKCSICGKKFPGILPGQEIPTHKKVGKRSNGRS